MTRQAKQSLESFAAEFPVAKTHAFLNHAGVGPTSVRAMKAVTEFMENLAHLGRPSFDDWEQIADTCRARFARLVGASPEEIAFIRNTSHGLCLLSAGLRWRRGDRVAVASDVEYPSNVYPWLDLARRGVVSVDLIEAPHGAVTAAGVEAALHPDTRVVAVSSAQYATGGVSELADIGSLCRERGVLLSVDGIQTVGALPTDVKGLGVGLLSADSHKWMLGMMGIGAVFIDRDLFDEIHPPLIGWRSTTEAFDFDRVHLELSDTASRYEEGSLAYPLIAGFSAALELLEDVGVEQIEARIGELVSQLVAGLEARGCVVGPDPRYRAHIATLRHPAVPGERLMEALESRGVVASLRRGAVRISPHFYNTSDDLERVFEAVDASIP